METGLRKFMNNKFLADVSIKIDEKTFKAHKVIVAASCIYYFRAFENESKTEFQFPPYVEPKFSSILPKDIFDSILLYMYTDQNIETLPQNLDENFVNAYMASSYALGINSLMSYSIKFIISHFLSFSNCVDYLQEGIKFYSEELKEASKTQVLQNFQEIHKNPESSAALTNLPYEIVKAIISSDELKVDSEKSVYSFVCDYVFSEGDKKKPLTNDQIVEIFGLVRWPFLSHSDLLEAAGNPKLAFCKDMILEGLSVQLAEHNKPRDYEYRVIRAPRSFYLAPTSSTPQGKTKTKAPEMPIRLLSRSQNNWKSYSKIENSRPRPPQEFFRVSRRSETEFLYSHDFDENGAFFYLGTYGKRQEWRNPHLLGLVQCFSSSIASGKIDDIVCRGMSNFKTKNEMGSFVAVDLGLNRSLKASAYTIRNGSSSLNTMLSWQFEGSVNGTDWTVLDRRMHSNAEEVKYLSEKGVTSTWGLASSDRNYRVFRIVQIDKNASGNTILSLSCFEIYGICVGQGWDVASIPT